MVADLAPYIIASTGGRDVVLMQRDIPPILQQVATLGAPRRLVTQLREATWGKWPEIRSRSISEPDLVQKQHLRVELQISSKNT